MQGSSITSPMLLLLLAMIATPVFGELDLKERYRWIDPTTSMIDDPRRLTKPPIDIDRSEIVVLAGGYLFDGTGTVPWPATVVIVGNRIESVLPHGSKDWESGARVIDATGMTLMPGLIDLHTHLTFTFAHLEGNARYINSSAAAALRASDRMRRLLESGITTVRDLGAYREVPFVLKSRWRAGELIGPRVFAVGQIITSKGGHTAEGYGPHSVRYGAIRIASGPDDWREAVREQFDHGADFIKLASHFSKDELRAAIEEAHALGLKVSVHADPYFLPWAVEAGADVIEHPFPRSDETIEAMVKRGIAAVPTLFPFVYIFEQRGGIFGTMSARFTSSPQKNLETVQRMKRAGVLIGVGTDMLGDLFEKLPNPYIDELTLLVKAGFTRLEALTAATSTGARILGLDDRLGQIKPGMLADIIAVRGRPDHNMTALRDIEYVLLNGKIVVEPD